MLNPDRVGVMSSAGHAVGVEMTLAAHPPADADAVTDLIEALVDTLDVAGFIPSVSATGMGATFRLSVEVITQGTELHALEAGIAGITKALAEAGVEDAANVRPFFRELQPA
jgi:hypothetical protein